MPITPTLQNLDNPEYAGEQELWAIEQNLTRYNSGLVHKFIHYLNPNGIVLDFGAGIGTLAILWTTITKKKPYCIEIDEKLRSIITNRGLVCFDSLNSMPGSVDGIYTSSVLEHIENDNEVIQQLQSKLKDKSYLLVYVPAFMFLYSHLDAEVGHYRRYSKKELMNKLRVAKFQICHWEYVDSIGFFVWLFLKWRGNQKNSSLKNPKSLQLYDKYIYPISNLLDKLGLKFLFGKNLFIVAKKIE